MNEKQNDGPLRDKDGPRDLSDFLASTPPYTEYYFEDLLELRAPEGGINKEQNIRLVRHPDIRIYCTSEICSGIRTFRPTIGSDIKISGRDYSYGYLRYLCPDCRSSFKIFSLKIKATGDVLSLTQIGFGLIEKLGEFPAFGPSTPARLMRMLQNNRDLFLKGRRCESQGLGIAAFAYYRRVVEDQKSKIIEEIIRACQLLNIDEEHINIFEQAKSEHQFKKSMELLKNHIPDTLFVGGQNPFTLLHSALSHGIHNESDQHCLEIAQSIRIILSELSERIGLILKNDSEIRDAISVLLDTRKD